MSRMNKFLISHLMLVTPLDWILSVDCEDLFEARLRLGDDDDEDDEDCVGKQLSFNGWLSPTDDEAIVLDLWPSSGDESDDDEDDCVDDVDRHEVTEDDITDHSTSTSVCTVWLLKHDWE